MRKLLKRGECLRIEGERIFDLGMFWRIWREMIQVMCTNVSRPMYIVLMLSK